MTTPASAKNPNPTATAPIGRIGLLASIERPLIAVDVDSPAAKAGLHANDEVKSVDGVATPTRAALSAALAASDPARDLVVVVERTVAKTDDAQAAKPTVLKVTIPGTAPVVVDVGSAQPMAPSPDPVAVDDLRYAVPAEDLTEPVVKVQTETATQVLAAVLRQRRDRGIASLEAAVASVEPETPAAARRLVAALPPLDGPPNSGHRVVAVDGAPVRIASDLAVALQKDPEAIHVIGLVDGAGEGATLTLRLQKSTRRELGGGRILGVSLTSTLGGAAVLTREVGAAEALTRAIGQTGETIKNVAGGYVLLVTGGVGLDQLGGPVLIATIAGEAARSGAEGFLLLMCMISVNLALLNLMPIPVLDGGHLLLFTVEAVRRKKLSMTARLRATQVGLVLVGALMAVALFNDVASLF